MFGRVNGSINFDDMVAHIDSVARNPDFSEGMNSFYDLSDCTNITGDVRELTQLAHVLNDSEFIQNPSKTAVVVPDDNRKICKLAQGLVLMVSKSKIDHRLFKLSEVESACAFVGISEDLVI